MLVDYYSFDFHIGTLVCQIARFKAFQIRPEDNTAPLLNHRHPFWELHCLFSGTLTLAAGPHTYRAKAGDLILIPPATYHYMASTSPDFDGMCLPFSLTRSKSTPLTAVDRQLLDTFQPNAAILVFPAGTELAKALNQLRQAAFSDETHYLYIERLRHLCPLVLLELLRQLDLGQRPTLSSQSALPYSVIIDEFFALYHKNGTRSMLAEKLHISTRQLNRILQKNYGMTFHEKRQEIRLKNAVELLQATTTPIHSIAEQLGFSSPSSFSAFILSATGNTPSQIRNASK